MADPARPRHLAPFLDALFRRKGLSARAAAAKAGVSHSALNERLQGRPGLAIGTVLRVAAASGADDADLERLADLDALDRGTLPVPENATADDVRRAREALRGAAA